jgi:secreted trypsin-like serine protease
VGAQIGGPSRIHRIIFFSNDSSGEPLFPKNWSLKGENDFTDIEDFGILILKESISINGKTTIATQEQIDLYIKNKTLVSTVGYGIQSVSHKQNDLTVPQYAEFPLESLDIVKTVLNTNKYYGMKINTVQIPGGPGTCPGDSGSAFYIKDGENFIYLGPVSWGFGGIPNCSNILNLKKINIFHYHFNL